MINRIQSAQSLKNNLKSININPPRVKINKTDLELFEDILKYEMRRCK